MAFREFTLASGRIAIVSSRTTRREGEGLCACGGEALYLCDYPLEQRQHPARCDRSLCTQCRRLQAPRTAERAAIDYCPEHDAVARARRADGNPEWGIGPAGDEDEGAKGTSVHA